MKTHRILGALLAGALLLAQPAMAQAPVAGKDYTLIEPAQQQEVAAGKVEVLEFFSFTCIHCAHLHPALKAWTAKQGKEVEVKRVPVSWGGRAAMVPTSKLFYTLEAMGELNRLDDAVFRAIHEQNVGLTSDDKVIAWVAKQGVDAKKFEETYRSFSIDAKVKRADQLAKAYGVSGTPAIAVGGKYMINNEIAGKGGWEAYLAVTDQVITLMRGPKSRGIRG